MTKSPLLFRFLNNRTLLAFAEEHIGAPLNVGSCRQLNCVSAATQLLTPRELRKVTAADLAATGGTDCHAPSLQPPTQTCTHPHARCSIHTVSAELKSSGWHVALQTGENRRISARKAEGSWNQPLPSASKSCSPQTPGKEVTALTCTGSGVSWTTCCIRSLW